MTWNRANSFFPLSVEWRPLLIILQLNQPSWSPCLACSLIWEPPYLFLIRFSRNCNKNESISIWTLDDIWANYMAAQFVLHAGGRQLNGGAAVKVWQSISIHTTFQWIPFCGTCEHNNWCRARLRRWNTEHFYTLGTWMTLFGFRSNWKKNI